MKNNKNFTPYLESIKRYQEAPTPAKLEDCKKESAKLIREGWATPKMKVLYDLSIEKYRTMGLSDLSIEVFDKDKSIRTILKKTYGIFLPKQPTEEIPPKKVIFNPHKPQNFSRNGIDMANLFMKNKFLSFKQDSEPMIDSMPWDKYPNIEALFKNVFKTKDRMDYFVNWLAYGFQTLEKTGTAIISKGVQGTGKGVIYEQIIQYAVGERYTTLLENEALKSRFNGELENKLFVLANEIKADFREGNTIYERLKMYVTDSFIRFEEKNTKAQTIPNFFNIWFHSNNDIPLQIQGGDRRYTVFNTASKKLEVVSEELGYEHIKFYIEEIIKERDSFIFDIMKIKYDIHSAKRPLQTEEKEMIYEASMGKLEILCDKIKKYDIEYFREPIEIFYESPEMSDHAVELKMLQLEGHLDFIIELNKQFNGNFITTKMLEMLYRIFVKPAETANAIGRQFGKHFKSTTLKKMDNKVFRYRHIDEDRKVIFQDEYPLEIEELDGTVKSKGMRNRNMVLDHMDNY